MGPEEEDGDALLPDPTVPAHALSVVARARPAATLTIRTGTLIERYLRLLGGDAMTAPLANIRDAVFLSRVMG
jgi:hypothetical protein